MSFAPLRHQNQNMAAANHVVLIYFDHDPDEYARLQNANCCTFFFWLLCVGGIIGGIVAIAQSSSSTLIIVGVGAIIGGLACGWMGKSQSDAAKKIDTKVGYCYYCYDISDQTVKLVVVNRETKSITKVPPESNLGHINDIREIKYYGNGSDQSFIAMKKVNAPRKARYNKTMNRLSMGKRNFCRAFTDRINAVKNMGLNDVQLQYQAQYGSGLNAIPNSNAVGVVQNVGAVGAVGPVGAAGVGAVTMVPVVMQPAQQPVAQGYTLVPVGQVQGMQGMQGVPVAGYAPAPYAPVQPPANISAPAPYAPSAVSVASAPSAPSAPGGDELPAYNDVAAGQGGEGEGAPPAYTSY